MMVRYAKVGYVNGPLGAAEKRAIIDCLIKHRGNQVRAAKELIINRNTLAKMIKVYGIDIKQLKGLDEIAGQRDQ